MTKRILLGLFMLPVIALLLSHSTAEARPRVAPLYNPDVINVEGMSFKQVEKKIRRAIFRRNWKIKEIKKGFIRATYIKESRKTFLKAVVNIRFTKKTVRIKYHDSAGFSYNKGAGLIHTRYNSWVRNIEKDIRANLGAY